MHGLVPWHHERPVFGVVVGVDAGQDRVMHVSFLITTGKVDEIELHGFRVRRFSCDHAGAVAGVTVVDQGEVIPIQVNHGDWVVVLG